MFYAKLVLKINGLPRLVKFGGLPLAPKQIGVVIQEDDLFAGSIAENISFFDTEADMQRVLKVAQVAMIHTEVMAMPMKYESLVGDMGW